MDEENLLIHGGEIITMDESAPSAEAVAVQKGTIARVGSAKDCREALGADFEDIDLEGRVLAPGFIDTHLHPVLMVYFDLNVDLRGIKSMGELKDRIRKMADSDPSAQWIVGLQFDEQELETPRLPDRRDLDEACSDRPVVVIKHDGHMVITNTRAIEACEVGPETFDPEGGVIEREKDGGANGQFRETAMMIPLNKMPLPDLDKLTAGARKTFLKLAASGITSVGSVLQTGEEGPAGSSGKFDVLAMQMLLTQIPISMYTLLIADDVAKIGEVKKTGLESGVPGGHKIGGIKIFSDGSFGACTACMRDPYSDQPDKSGFLVRSEEDIFSRMAAAHQAGYQIATHAIGDKANRVCIDLYKRLLKEMPRADHRHRLEHASLLDADMIKDMARLGLIVSSQPQFIHSEKHWLHKRLGPERAKWTYPFRSLVAGGVKVAGASDAPVESVDVLDSIYVLATREGFETRQCISAADAMRMFTIDAAYAQFEDKVKGSISQGKRADMIILSENPITSALDKIRGIRVLRTFHGGKTIYGE